MKYPGASNNTDTCNYCNSFTRKSFKGTSALIKRLFDAPFIGVT